MDAERPDKSTIPSQPTDASLALTTSNHVKINPYAQSPPPPSYNGSGPSQYQFKPFNQQSQPPQSQYPMPPANYPQGQPYGYDQQQQQSVVVVGAANPTPTFVQVPTESYRGHQSLAIFVTFCCNVLFGAVAWVLALTADGTKFTDPEKARRLGKASLGVSISGVVVTIIIVAILFGVTYGTTSCGTTDYGRRSTSGTSTNMCTYTVFGGCYSSRRYVGISCGGSFSYCCYSDEDYYYSGYCYTK